MNGEIIVHRQASASLKLFLDELGYKSVWELEDEDHDKLIVLQNGDTKFIKAVFQEYEASGFIPYHYSVHPETRGKIDKSDKIEFIGTVKSKQIFRNVSGDFMLVLFQSEERNNYLWKSYKLDRQLEIGDEFKISGRFVAPLKGLRREQINLINYVRIKEIENVKGKDSDSDN